MANATRRQFGILGTAAALLFGLLSLPALAAEGDAARAETMWRAGRYGDAEALLDAARKAEPKSPVVAAARADLFLELGRPGDAEQAAREGGDDPRCLTLLGESFLLRGKLDEASACFEKAVAAEPDLLRARYDAGRVHLLRGERDDARKAFAWFFDYYATHDVTGAENLTLVALASIRLAELNPDVAMNFDVTLHLLDKVTKDYEDYLPAYVARGRLFLDVYQDQDAKKSFELALKRNQRYPAALLGLADQAAFRFQETAGVGHCRDALLTNPDLFAAREYIARVELGDSRYEDATAEIEKVLAVNPRRRAARGLLAARDYLLGKRDEYERRMKELLADDPHYAGGYVDLVQVLEQQRRFAEAAEVAKTGTQVDPQSWRAFWAYGRNLVHLGRESEAKKALETSRGLDPFAQYSGNPFRENMIEVLGHLEEFVETRTDHFIYKIFVSDNSLLKDYYHRFLEHSFAMLTKKYDFVPEGPILTEIFNRHEDFAARTVGLPGIGALGACFGKVITLDSPSCRPPGAFCWASTAHHEFAHVITLQLSKGRVPRWFTEGLSVFEEREYETWWDRDMDRRLYDAWSNGELPPILRFNAEFRGGDVLFAYYLGGMMCEFLKAEFGFPKIVEMLKAYGKDEQTPEVLNDVLGISPDEYDRRFSDWVGRRVGSYRLVANWSDRTVGKMKQRLETNAKDADALITLAFAYLERGNTVDAMNFLGKALVAAPDDRRLDLLRGELAFRSGRKDHAQKWLTAFLDKGGDDFTGRMHLAKLLLEQRDYEGAMAQFEAAKQCFPLDPAPYHELARLKKGANDLAGAMAEMEGYVRLENTDIEGRMELADYYESQEEWKKLADILTQVVWIYPLGKKSAIPVHARLARTLHRLGRREESATEYEEALELGVPDDKRVEIRVELARVYLELGKVREARFQARSALEIDPGNSAAKGILEQAQGR